MKTNKQKATQRTQHKHGEAVLIGKCRSAGASINAADYRKGVRALARAVGV